MPPEFHERNDKPELVAGLKIAELVKKARKNRDALTGIVIDELGAQVATIRNGRVDKTRGQRSNELTGLLDTRLFGGRLARSFNAIGNVPKVALDILLVFARCFQAVSLGR